MDLLLEKQDNVKFEEALEIAGYGKFNIFVTLISGLTVASSILNSRDTSYLMQAAECDFQLSSRDKGLLASATFLGMLCASHMSGFIADTMGRKYVLVRGLFLNVIIYILGSLAPNFWTFFILKVLTGVVTCPCMIATYPLLSEFMPAKRRPQAMLICTSLIFLGSLYSSVLAWATLSQQWRLDLWFVTFTPWRLFYLLCGLPSLLCLALLYLTPESPKFLLTRGKTRDTMEVLRTMYSVNSGNAPQSYPVRSVSMDADEILPPPRERGAMGALKQIYDQTLPLFRTPYLRNLSLCVVMYFTTLLCVNSMYLWLPEFMNRTALYKELHEGKFYLCQMMWKRAVTDNALRDTSSAVACEVSTVVFLSNLLIALVQPFVHLIAVLAIPFIDRRTAFMIVMLLSSIMLVLVTRVSNMYIIYVLLGGVPILVGVCMNILTSIFVELFPTYIRAMAGSLALLCGRVGTIFGSYIFSSLIDAQCSLLFMIVSGIMLFCAAVPFCLKMSMKPNQPQKQDIPVMDVKK